VKQEGLIKQQIKGISFVRCWQESYNSRLGFTFRLCLMGSHANRIKLEKNSILWQKFQWNKTILCNDGNSFPNLSYFLKHVDKNGLNDKKIAFVLLNFHHCIILFYFTGIFVIKLNFSPAWFCLRCYHSIDEWTLTRQAAKLNWVILIITENT
jgi:hypothetical protein